MPTRTLAVTAAFAIGLTGAGAAAQDLFPTPEGRLGGREPLPSPAAVMLTPVPPTPTVAPTATPLPPTGTPVPGAATPVSGDTAAVEPGAFEAVRASTVTVLAWRGDRPLIGSGWVYADGRVVTVAPLVADAERVEVAAADGRLISAELVGADPLSGVALLEADDLAAPPLPVGAAVEPGLGAVAVGTADGAFPGTMAYGAISSASRSLPGHYPTTPLILAAMTLPDGMGGGPLVDEASGAVVGVVVPGPSPAGSIVAGPPVDLPPVDLPPAIDLPPGIGPQGPTALPSGEPGLAFAVPISTVERVVADLAAEGRVAYPFLGAALEPVGIAEAARLGLPSVGGAVVREVVAGGPAAQAGIAPGDVIVGFGGEPIGPDRPLPSTLAEREPGETVSLDLLRDGDRLAVEVRLGERPEAP